jgi:hypothetical protein
LGVSLFKGTEITEAFVENHFLPVLLILSKVLKLIDENLAQFNEHTDRRFDSLLYDIYPSLRNEVKEDASNSMHDENINVKRIPVLISVIWYEFLSSLCNTLLINSNYA